MQSKIDGDLYEEWVQNPCTQSLMLQIQIKVYEKEDFLASGSYIDEEKGLIKAAKADGARLALIDILDSDYEEAR